ncbi:MAG: DUF2922 domain-containing protein [Phascolarctobacterium sp.]|nr:DUF2922 domain-containing protein [Phascolarctobacterium sp.]
MTKTLELVFKIEDGSSKTISIKDPREDITRSEADTVMATIINENVFATAGGAYAEAVTAQVRTVDIATLQ